MMPRSKLTRDSHVEKVPSLASQSKRSLTRKLPDWCVQEMGMVSEEGGIFQARAVRASAIKSRGRILEMHDREDDAMAQVAKPNFLGKIDGARFKKYEDSTKTVTIRVDHSTHPSFWMELEFCIPDLEHWLGSQGE